MRKILLLVVCSLVIFLVGCAARAIVKPDYDFGKIRRVAILPFVSTSRDVSERMTDLFTTEVVGVGQFDVIERQRLEKILKEQKMGTSGVLDIETIRKIGKIAGIDAAFIGSVHYESPYWLLTLATLQSVEEVSLKVRLVEIETGITLWSASCSSFYRFSGEKDMERVARKIGKQLRKTVKENLERRGGEIE